MKWAYQVNSKAKAAIVLLIIIGVIFLCNLSLRKSFSRLGTSISSMYNDRLMPATYIFKITDLLYQKRLLYASSTATVAQLTQANTAIQNLLQQFEASWLTAEENIYFKKLQKQITLCQDIEKSWIAMPYAERNANLPSTLIDCFTQSRQLLDELSSIQVKEGSAIRKQSESIIKGTRLESQLEISLLIVLGLAAITLASLREKLAKRENQRSSLN